MAIFDIDDIEKELHRMQERMNKLFVELRKPFSMLETTSVPRRPVTEMTETPESIIVSFELPGMDKKDISLEVTENRIKIKAAKKKEEETRKKGFYKSVREARAFYHEETLPARIIPEEAKAEYKAGILKVILPKKEKVKVKVKRVKIK
jgi:HSP20 family protein